MGDVRGGRGAGTEKDESTVETVETGGNGSGENAAMVEAEKGKSSMGDAAINGPREERS
jgi:hypothetical protein